MSGNREQESMPWADVNWPDLTTVPVFRKYSEPNTNLSLLLFCFLMCFFFSNTYIYISQTSVTVITYGTKIRVFNFSLHRNAVRKVILPGNILCDVYRKVYSLSQTSAGSTVGNQEKHWEFLV